MTRYHRSCPCSWGYLTEWEVDAVRKTWRSSSSGTTFYKLVNIDRGQEYEEDVRRNEGHGEVQWLARMKVRKKN